jgi:hypothetical protein
MHLLALLVNLSLCLASATEMESKGDSLSPSPLLETRRTISNLQMFTSTLGGIAAPPIAMSNDSKRPYEVDGSTFPDFATAAKKTCDVQYNACQDAANENTTRFTVGDCDNQRCKLIFLLQYQYSRVIRSQPANSSGLIP